MSVLKKASKLLVQIITGLLFCLLLIAIYGKMQMLIFKQNYSTLFGYTMFQVASGSMQPTLNIDDVILVKITDDIKLNDIISYEDNGSIITHRVLSTSGDKLIVKGDANNTVDIPIDKNLIIGKVIKIFPELKIWQDILTDPKILFFLFLTLLLFDFAFSYKKNKKQTDVEEDKIVKYIPNIEEPKKPKKEKEDVIEANDLLDLTQRIDPEELNILINNKKELATLILDDSKKVKSADINKEIKYTTNKELPDYTIRFDLKEIQKQISKKIK